MVLASGVRVGLYVLRAQIGAGGMGEVYQAHDARLNRDVALKILPESFALDPDRLARFRREAQVLASLNHPNIASIYGFEESDGVHALVLELVEGPTLADRIAEGPVTMEEALPMARQIADGLEAAHAQGIVHRDLKPANIKIRPDGTVKVLDFGLAKALSDDRTPGGVTQSPTMTSPALTQLGIILGTAAYMSPEQARGRPADKRSDIWAFGAVLYEMLAGRRAFDGDDTSYTLANILKSEPEWNALPADTPSRVRRVLRRCLEKDPKSRSHDIADVRLDLDDSDLAVAPPLSVTPRLLNRERVAWALLVAALAGSLAYSLGRKPPGSPVVRFQIDPPVNGYFGSSTGAGQAEGTSGGSLSPDGTLLAFVATERPDRTQLWVRRLDSFTARPLPGTANALLPFWSPDSRWLGFFADGKVKRIDTVDGSVQTIADAPGSPRGGAWGSRDVIVFGSGAPSKLARVSSRGGEVTVLDVGYGRWPFFLPDGRHFLYTGLSTGSASLGILIGSIDARNGIEPRSLVPAESNGAFAPPGVLLFMRGERLMQQRFDPDRLEVSGEATPVAEQVFYNPGVARGDFSVSATGLLAYRSGAYRTSQFAWFDRAGKILETVGAPGNYRASDLSPDGQRLAYADVNLRDIWILDLSRKTASRFTSDPGTESAPIWFPDGNRIAYRSDFGGLFEKDVAGSGTGRMLLKASSLNGPDQVSSDGKWILYFLVTPGGNQDVYVLPTTGDPKPQMIVQTPFPDVEPQFSPDVRWLAYASSENGRNEVYVQAFPSTGRRWQVSSAGGRQPLWRADGKELFFVSDERKFYAVDVSEKDGIFQYGVPQFLFDMRANVFNTRNSYIPNRDGTRFLVNMLLDADDSPISVVQNWRATVQ